MKTIQQTFTVCSLGLLLAACGGSTTETPAPTGTKTLAKFGASTAPAQSAMHAPEEYRELLQRLYMVFFGRPADVDGLFYWQRIFSERSVPATLGELMQAYSADAGVKQLIDNFVDSSESQGLYTGNTAAFVNAVYRNTYNRNAEAEGLAFWSGFVARGELSRGQVALRILDGGQNDDAIVLAKKTQASINFTVALAKKEELAKRSYIGDSVNQAVRDLLGTVTATTDIAAFQAQIDAMIESFTYRPDSLPSIQRYSGFSYLQDMASTPSYSAYYRYFMGEFGFFTGSVIFAEVPRTVTWGLSAPSQTISYAAPITAAINFKVASVAPATTAALPDVAMLCQSVAGTPAILAKSTDILVANSAKAVLEASALANQSFTYYRENCALAGEGGVTPNVQSFVFDAAGNAVVKAQKGSATYSASVVTKALNGQVLLDVSTGKYLTLRVYRIVNPSGATGFVIVEHQGDALTGLKEGVLGMWTQQ
ncbi:DUF4214 domain-containing protein [Rugamonas sp. DEMB1]|uniref:DUF4214 domain-containing protein n=1 Tax=Rugamonas sp. DEMB1 TaxID=3039386 RepID=UPI00244AE639|nr:DUF4214 domain-containing protein [Rugamonas sp. DEMB1]WGG49065.1 DUF4214 domain-containing protein [Rugamonas sp. DEMB1]